MKESEETTEAELREEQSKGQSTLIAERIRFAESARKPSLEDYDREDA